MSGNTVRTPIIDKNGKATTVHKNAGSSKVSSNRLQSIGTPPKSHSAPKSHPALSDQQKKVINATYQLKPIVMKDGSVYEPGHLVSGHEYRTAIALENKGLGNVKYQGKSLGWFKLNEKGSNAANFERITEEAKITDKSDPKYNTDMDIIFPGTKKTYRDLILAGFDPNIPDDQDAFVKEQMGF